MRRFMLFPAILALALSVGALTASAQTTVDLNTTTGDVVVFTSNGDGSTAGVSAGACSTGSQCLSGGLGGNLPDGTIPSGTYSLDFSTANVTMTQITPPTLLSPAVFGLSQTGNIGFTMNTTVGNLTGTVSLVDFGNFKSTGIFNGDFVANLTITGGTTSLVNEYSSGTGAVQLVIHASNADVSTLVGESVNSTLVSTFSKGSLDPVPEPASMLLYGTGIFLIGGILRRRLL